MQDLNDLYYFSQIVEHGGFSAASRALNIPKSRLSRRMTVLEEALGMRLLQRTTRRLRLTTAGERFLHYCQEMAASARAAHDAMQHLKAEPAGSVRISCPVAIAQQMLAPALPEFLDAWPDVTVEVLVTNRRVDLISEGVDLAIRVREQLNTDAELVVRHLGSSGGCLVASPAYLTRFGTPTHPDELIRHRTLSFTEPGADPRWTLRDEADNHHAFSVAPSLVCNDFSLLVEAAERGRGIALLPTIATQDARRAGKLVELLPQWRSVDGLLHIIYPSRRGMMPAVRLLVDFLAERLVMKEPRSGGRTDLET